MPGGRRPVRGGSGGPPASGPHARRCGGGGQQDRPAGRRPGLRAAGRGSAGRWHPGDGPGGGDAGSDEREYFAVSACTGQGVAELVRAPRGPAAGGPRLLPARPAQRPDRGVVGGGAGARAAADRTREELPHSIATRVTEWEWPRIRCEILVERESQKGIVIGKGGEVLKAVGTAVRQPAGAGRLPGAARQGGARLAAPPRLARPPRLLNGARAAGRRSRSPPGRAAQLARRQRIACLVCDEDEPGSRRRLRGRRCGHRVRRPR